MFCVVFWNFKHLFQLLSLVCVGLQLVVFRKHSVVQVFNVVEHGRKFYRSLVFTSDYRFCLHNLKPESASNSPSTTQTTPACTSFAAGDALAVSRPNFSLVITRNLGISSEGNAPYLCGKRGKLHKKNKTKIHHHFVDRQVYIPPRFLAGLLPVALIERSGKLKFRFFSAIFRPLFPLPGLYFGKMKTTV